MSNSVEYAQRHLEAFYLMYGIGVAGAAEKPTECKLEGGIDHGKCNHDSGRT